MSSGAEQELEQTPPHLSSVLPCPAPLQMYENVLKVCLPWLWDLDESVWVLLPQTSNDGAAAATACRQVARGKGKGRDGIVRGEGIH